MSYVTPFHKRMRLSERRRERYRNDPDYRLARVNEQRRLRGQEPLASVDEIGTFHPTWTRRDWGRDDKGRFA